MITEESSAVMIAHAEGSCNKEATPSIPSAFFCKESEAASSLYYCKGGHVEGGAVLCCIQMPCGALQKEGHDNEELTETAVDMPELNSSLDDKEDTNNGDVVLYV